MLHTCKNHHGDTAAIYRQDSCSTGAQPAACSTHIAVGLFKLVQQNNTVRLAPHCLGQRATLIVAYRRQKREAALGR